MENPIPNSRYPRNEESLRYDTIKYLLFESFRSCSEHFFHDGKISDFPEISKIVFFSKIVVPCLRTWFCEQNQPSLARFSENVTGNCRFRYRGEQKVYYISEFSGTFDFLYLGQFVEVRGWLVWEKCVWLQLCYFRNRF